MPTIKLEDFTLCYLSGWLDKSFFYMQAWKTLDFLFPSYKRKQHRDGEFILVHLAQ